MKLICPEKELPREQRINALFVNISEWLYSNAMSELIRLFGGIPRSSGSLNEYIDYLNDFAEIWNYRAKIISSEKERWNVYDDNFVTAHKKTIMECAEELGLVNETLPTIVPDYILPLGGARFSNFNRPKYAEKMYEYVRQIEPTKQVNIVALSGTRLISDKERIATNQYAPDAETEFDAMNAGLVSAFALTASFSEKKNVNDNINLNSVIRQYQNNLKNVRIESIAAPSSDPARRANSRDTFEFFLENYHISGNDNILLVTSQIYVPYQLLKFIDLAIEGSYNVECVGYGMEQMEALAKPSNFLQEIKGTINAINTLKKIYR